MKERKVSDMTEQECREYLTKMEQEAREILADADASPDKKDYARSVLKTLGIDAGQAESESRRIGRAFAPSHPSGRGPVNRGSTLVLEHMSPAQARARVKEIEDRRKLGFDY
jgi:hypothetical protein